MRPISNIETEKDQDSALVAIQALMSEQDRASSESLRMPNGAVAQGDSGPDIVEPASATTGRTIADRLMQIGRTASAHPRFLAIGMLTLLVLWKPVVQAPGRVLRTALSAADAKSVWPLRLPSGGFLH